MRAYTGSITPLNVSKYYKGMPGIAEARLYDSGLDKRQIGEFQLTQVHLHICLTIDIIEVCESI